MGVKYLYGIDVTGQSTFSTNVGIGTLSPVANLHVNSSTTDSVLQLTNSTSGALISDGLRIAMIGNVAAFLLRESADMWFATSNTERLRITSAGNVGIGTTAPIFSAGSGLQIVRSDYANVRLTGGTSVGLDLLQSSDGTGYLRNRDNAQLRLGTNNVDVITLTSTGNVGIGTTTPLRKLHVAGEVAINASGSQYYGVYINGAGEGANPNILIGDWHNSSANFTWDSVGNYLRIDAQNSTIGAPIVFSGNDGVLEYARFTATGNLGIGTSAPLYKLHVDDDVAYGGIFIEGNNAPGLSIRDNSGTSLSIIYVQSTAGSQGNLRISSDNNNTATTPTIEFLIGGSEKMRILDGGNVGIGTTAPGSKLQVGVGVSNQPSPVASLGGALSGILSTLSLVNTSGNAVAGYGTALDFHVNSGYSPTGRIATIAESTGTQTALAFYTYNDGLNEKLRITSAGNVGIGTTSPGAKLEVNGNIKLSSAVGSTATPSYIWLGNDYSNGTTRDKLKIYLYNSGTEQYGFSVGPSSDVQYHSNILHDFYIANSLKVRINGSGNVGIGTTAPAAKLHVEGGNAIFNNGLADTILFIETDADGTYDPIFQMGSGQNTIASEGFEIWYANNVGDVHISTTYNDAAASIRFHTATGASKSTSNERMVITGAGNVGIGTTAPAAKLDVEGDIAIKNVNLSNQENLDVDTGTEVIAIAPIALYTAAFFDFVVKNGANVRSGTVYACHDGTSVEYTETSTADLGNTSAVVFTVDISAGNMRLLATTTTDNWSIKTLTRTI